MTQCSFGWYEDRQCRVMAEAKKNMHQEPLKNTHNLFVILAFKMNDGVKDTNIMKNPQL